MKGSSRLWSLAPWWNRTPVYFTISIKTKYWYPWAPSLLRGEISLWELGRTRDILKYGATYTPATFTEFRAQPKASYSVRCISVRYTVCTVEPKYPTFFKSWNSSSFLLLTDITDFVTNPSIHSFSLHHSQENGPFGIMIYVIIRRLRPLVILHLFHNIIFMEKRLEYWSPFINLCIYIPSQRL